MKVMTLAVTAALCVSSLFAVEVAQLKGLPRGVQNIRYKAGVISTLVVVGHASIPKALRRSPGRAAQYAGAKARDEAYLEFTRFLSTKCKWGKTAAGETAVKEEAASATDAQGNESSAESSSFTETEMSKEQKELAAQARVSGIQGIWEGINDMGEYVWVGAWSADAAKSIPAMGELFGEAAEKVNPEEKKPDNPPPPPGTPVPPAKPVDPSILPTMTKPGTPSGDADKFFGP